METIGELDVDLLARQVIAASLSEAMVDRRARPAAPLPASDPRVLRCAWSVLAEAFRGVPPVNLGLGELRPESVNIEPLVRWLALDPIRRGELYQVIFGLVASRDCTPYETEYCHWSDPTYRAQQMADIAGFYHAFGVEPSERRPERCDHVSLEIEFVAFLLQKTTRADHEDGTEPAGVCRAALRNFLKDHIVWWVPTFARCIERRVERMLPGIEGGPTREALADWAGAAQVLRAWCAAERVAHQVEPSRRIIAPMVEPPPTEEDESCAGCTATAEPPR